MTRKNVLQKVCDGVNKENSDSTNHNSLYSRGLSSEGYAGGYTQAIQDVILYLNGVIPNSRYEYIWRKVILGDAE